MKKKLLAMLALSAVLAMSAGLMAACVFPVLMLASALALSRRQRSRKPLPSEEG